MTKGTNFGRMEINIDILNLKLLNGDCHREDEARYNCNMRVSEVVLGKEGGDSGGEAFNGGCMEDVAIWSLELKVPVLN